MKCTESRGMQQLGKHQNQHLLGQLTKQQPTQRRQSKADHQQLPQAYPGQQAVHEELGDLLFVAVNLARRLDVDAETALRDANIKFERRFRSIENRIAATGTAIQDADMDQMQSAWEAVKKTEKSQTDAA